MVAYDGKIISIAGTTIPADNVIRIYTTNEQGEAIHNGFRVVYKNGVQDIILDAAMSELVELRDYIQQQIQAHTHH